MVLSLVLPRGSCHKANQKLCKSVSSVFEVHSNSHSHFQSRIVLLNKLLEDGNVLYRKNRLIEASHRYQYALKKIPSDLQAPPTEDGNEDYAHIATYQQLKFNFLINLSRCKRKMNVSLLIWRFVASSHICFSFRRFPNQ